MSLTQDDLKAVKRLIDSSIDERVPGIIDDRVQPMLDKLEDRTFKRLTKLESKLTRHIDEATEALAIQTENGLQEVRGQIGQVKRTVKRIERVQQSRDMRDKLKASKIPK